MEYPLGLKVCPIEYKVFEWEWESHRVALEKMKESKEKQHQRSQEERDTMYPKMLQNLERTGAAIRSSINKASTIFL